VKETPHGLGGRAWGGDQRGQLDRLSGDLGDRVEVLVEVQDCRRELLPVLTTGAEVMDTIFKPQTPG